MGSTRPITGSIKGRLTDFNEFPIAEASVIIVKGPTHADIAAITDDRGTFGFGNLRPGNYTLKAFTGDIESEEIAVRVYARKAAVIEIGLDINYVTEILEISEEYSYPKNNVVPEL